MRSVFQNTYRLHRFGFFKLPTLIAAVLLVNACTPNLGSGPDGQIVNGRTAALLFNSVCAETAPTFSNYFTRVTDGTYRRDPATDTYNHITFDMSFQLREGGIAEICAMRFRSNEDAIALALYMTGAVTADGPVDLDPATGFASREVAPNVQMIFQPAIDGDNEHVASIEVGVL